MKKRILSIFLSAVMLLCAVPFAAQAEEVAAPATGESIAYDLYVSDGLKALYTAFDQADIDLAAGKWTDRVNGNVATLGNKQYWALGANGRGVGTLMLWGSYIDGVFNESAATNNFDVVGTRLAFGIDQLPVADYTVEYVAQYNSVMAVDENGEPVKAINTIDGATWPNNAAVADTTYAYVAIDTLGNLQSFSKDGRDKAFTADGIFGGLGSLVWKHNSNRPDDGWNQGNGADGLWQKGEIWQTRGTINTFEISRDATGDTNNVITLTKNSTLYATKTFTETIAAERDQTLPNFFYLGERLSVDYYTVRIYDRILTAQQRNTNRLADLILYYDLSANSLTALQNLANTTDFAGYAFETDATAIAATKAKLQSVLNDGVDTQVALYVQKGLKALYTAYGTNDTSANLATGTWKNRVLGGADALFNSKVAGQWEKGALGGVGYDLIWGVVTKDETTGAYSFKKSYHPNMTMPDEMYLNLGIENLPAEDFTLEYVALYGETMACLGSATSGVLVPLYGVDENGVPYAGTGMYPNSSEYQSWPVDSIGLLHSMTQARGGNCDTVKGQLRWKVVSWENTGWSNDANGNGENFKTANRADGKIHTYLISRDETTAETVTTAVYTHGFDGASVSTQTYATDKESPLFYYSQAEEESSKFWLSHGLTTDFYAVRLYDRLLTEEEQAQNRFADLINYYGVLLPEGFVKSETALAGLKASIADLGFENDATLYETAKATIETAIENEKTTFTVEIGTEQTQTTIFGDVWTAPATVEGKELLGWQIVGEKTVYAAGDAIAVQGDTVVRAVALAKPETTSDYSVKMMGDHSLGMRFTATLSKADYLSLLNAYGKANVSLGMLITPAQYVERAGVFTKEGLTAWAQGLHSSETPYVEIAIGAIWKMDGDVLTLAGSLYSFSEKTMSKNVSFASVAYVSIDTDGNGEADAVIYGDYAAQTNRTVKEVMEWVNKNHRADLFDLEIAWLESFLAYYEDKE